MLDRVFLGSGTHLLPAIADWVLDQHAEGEGVDASGHLLVLPTGRARRRLEMLLLEQAHARRLVPPELMTPSGLLDRFLVPTQPVADTLTGQLAWLSAIRTASPEDRQAITGHDADPTNREAVALATRLASLMHELGAGGYTPGEALACSRTAGLPLDEARWIALANTWEAACEFLAAAGRVDVNVARREALDADRIHGEGIDAVTVVSADPTRLVSRLLHSQASSGVRVTSIIHGNESELADAFDEQGAVVLDTWDTRPIDLSSARLVTCDRVDDQVAAVLEHLADRTEAEGELEASTTVVVPDDSLVPRMERHLERHGVPLRLTSTRSPEDGRIGRLLVILANLLEDQSARHFGDLVRHPDVEHWLSEQGVDRPVATWDDLWNRHLPRTLEDLHEGSSAHHRFSRLLGDLLDLLEPLHGQPRSASDWVGPVMDVLRTLVTASDTPLGSADESALWIIREALEGQLDLVGSHSPEVSACDVIRLLREQLRSGRTAHHEGGVVSLAGWLDAHLDDAPHLVITGLNEHMIPSAASVDPWLPEPVREALDLSSQRRRTARDAWLLTAILQGGRSVTLVTARRADLGDPLIPSRLLLRDSGPVLARRVQDLVSEFHRGPELVQWRAQAEVDSAFTPRYMPEGEPVINHMSVTAFKRFLSSPSNFLLERDERLRLTTVETLDALDPMGFGSLVHEVLEQWGREEMDRHEVDAETIERDLLAMLDQHARDRFGTRPTPGVRLQISIAAHRLRAFAPVQAARSAAGWRIHLVEADFSPRGYPPPMFPGPDGLPLRGKIDRVDVHEVHGYQALDYKTGATGLDPVQAHGSRKKWTDLQLPLYRFLLRSIDIDVPSDGLGYITLPPDAMQSGVKIARWTDEQFDGAEETGAEVIRLITGGGLLAAAEASLP